MKQICYNVDISIQQHRFLNEFRMAGMPSLCEKLEKFVKLLVIFFLYLFLFYLFSPIAECFSNEFVDLISVLVLKLVDGLGDSYLSMKM